VGPAGGFADVGGPRQILESGDVAGFAQRQDRQHVALVGPCHRGAELAQFRQCSLRHEAALSSPARDGEGDSRAREVAPKDLNATRADGCSGVASLQQPHACPVGQPANSIAALEL